MKKKLLTLLLVSSLLFVNGCFISDWYDDVMGNDETEEELESEELTFKTEDGDHTFNVEVADKSYERRKGLMDRETLADDAGMLFVFNDEGFRNFWMKDTQLYLDIIFISADKKVVDIKKDFEPCYSEDCPDYRSKREAKYVVEVRGGTSDEKGIKVGDEVEFEI